MNKITLLLLLFFIAGCDDGGENQTGYVIQSIKPYTVTNSRYLALPIKGSSRMFFIDKDSSFNIGDTIFFTKNTALIEK